MISIANILISAAIAISTNAQDSIQISTLQEIVVEADMQYANKDDVVVRPTINQKRTSQNAFQLISRMGIPGIAANATNKEIKDFSGGDIKIFINFVEADNQQLESLLPDNVRRVEYLTFPSDPRFQGAQRVLNIIVQEYNYGGYTKLFSQDNFFSDFRTINGVYSKFNYKSMSYDIFAGGNYQQSNHNGYDLGQKFMLTNNAGENYIVERTEKLNDSYLKGLSFPVSFRAVYTSKNIQINSTIGYTHAAQPKVMNSGFVISSLTPNEEQTFLRNNNSGSNSFSYSGNFFFSLPKQFSINLTPTISYSHRNDNYSYQLADQLNIIRNARENAVNYRINLVANKQYKVNNFSLQLCGGENINNVGYVGNIDFKDHFSGSYIFATLVYKLNLNKVNIFADAGYVLEQTNINNYKLRYNYPTSHINIAYSPTQKHKLALYGQYAASTPGVTEKTADILQDNEYMYFTGNPDLNNSNFIQEGFSYTWLPANNLYLSLYNTFFCHFDRIVNIYTPYKPNTIIQSCINDGNFINAEIGINANWKLLNNSLQLLFNPSYYFYKSTGIYDQKLNPFRVYVQATYYLRNLYFEAWYLSKSRQLNISTMELTDLKNYHCITIGGRFGNFNVNLEVANFLNKGWKGTSQHFTSDIYSYNKDIFQDTYHFKATVNVTYTFQYGKKVQIGNEIREQSGASSAILKN